MALPCLGDRDSMQRTLAQLASKFRLPEVRGYTVAETRNSPRHRFAQPSARHLALHVELTASTGVEWDLVYAPRGWELVLDNWQAQFDDDWGAMELVYLPVSYTHLTLPTKRIV
eukprot:TRINITY_DN8898_c0_g1_i9.p1 TRINITY_DN8898_c0_g1~~TRINITY_DN8898_c0_g1_i9.p1  ORF type:complete len:114 (+),score=7.45 TRINITY_DN8898_c0_g1_i9:310-651(+)